MCACPRKIAADYPRASAGERIDHFLLATHPHHPGIREWFCASTRCPMILAAVNLYSPLQYLVLAKSRKAGQLAILRPHRGEAVQDRGYGLRRITLPRTRVNSVGCPH